MIRRLLRRYETARPFTDDEAWLLFKLAAFAEAAGWSLLILGILVKQFILPGNDIPVLIAGQLHGSLFLLYIVAALGLYPSLGWSRKRAIVAGLASVPPFGSLVFEQWAASQRRTAAVKLQSRLAVYDYLLAQA